MKPERASKLSVSTATAFSQSAFRFMGYHGCFNPRLVLQVFFVVVVFSFLRNKAYVLQKRNTKLSFVSPHLKDLGLSFFQTDRSSVATPGEERRKESC